MTSPLMFMSDYTLTTDIDKIDFQTYCIKQTKKLEVIKTKAEAKEGGLRRREMNDSMTSLVLI